MGTRTKAYQIALVGIIGLILVAALGFYLVDSRGSSGSVTACISSYSSQTVPNEFEGLVAKIRANATFIALEGNRNFSYVGIGRQAVSYSNGTILNGTTIVTFECGNERINAYADPAGNIILISSGNSCTVNQNMTIPCGSYG